MTNGDKALVSMITGKFHIALSERRVARYWLRRGKTLTKASRFAFARYGVKCHRENASLYQMVTSGSI